MMQRKILGVALAGLLMNGQPATAQESDRLWSAAPKSMSQYISEGWQVRSHTHEQFDNGHDYTFTLQKDNQAVICFIWRPNRGDMEASCRLLN